MTYQKEDGTGGVDLPRRVDGMGMRAFFVSQRFLLGQDGGRGSRGKPRYDACSQRPISVGQLRKEHWVRVHVTWEQNGFFAGSFLDLEGAKI